ncbi:MULTISPECIES: DUF502 domain-containing protein [Fusobacterium]|uniref:DUF502 domain-containing protein n=1 Tax=Fusobacterium TaxID=848 RepID=UPI001F31F431|nr:MULTISPECIES: DUF502 domain-containing protein [Fusobacterium]MCF2611953.1 DUF502 domain-containing protein [Fusobacterium perfoetens]MDY2981088.1 DUF502 domain-containing protein [Fusobacterium sp.]
MPRGIRNHFYAGMIVVLPIFLTIFILNWIINLVISLTTNSFLVKIINKFIYYFGFQENEKVVYIVYGVYLLIILLSIVFVGVITKNIVGKKIRKGIDNLICKLPIIKQIYTTMKQIVKLISSQKNPGYKKVIVVEYPRKGIYSIGFLTAEDNFILKDAYGKEFHNIFIPTSPNPTSGMFICVPKEDVKELDMSIEEAIKLIVSGGVITPGVNYDEDDELEENNSTEEKELIEANKK